MNAVLLIAAIVLCFAASWNVLPPFFSGVLPLTVGVPELAPWLLAAALLACALTVRSSSADATARAAL